MNENQKAAFINAAVARATIRALAMHAENMQREGLGQSMAYREEDFLGLIAEEGLHHNAVVSFFFE